MLRVRRDYTISTAERMHTQRAQGFSYVSRNRHHAHFRLYQTCPYCKLSTEVLKHRFIKEEANITHSSRVTQVICLSQPFLPPSKNLPGNKSSQALTWISGIGVSSQLHTIARVTLPAPVNEISASESRNIASRIYISGNCREEKVEICYS